MKFFIALLAVAALAHAADHTEEEIKAWQEFKLEHGKLFLSPGKEAKRMNTFVENKRAVEEHNAKFVAGEVTHVVSINPYSDLTPSAFLKRFGGVEVPAEARVMSEKFQAQPETRQLPAAPRELDLSKLIGAGWKVRDQQSCGSCWTFSTVAAIEYAYWKQTYYLGDLAEQQLVDCVYSHGGCSGGWMPTAMEHIAKVGGMVYEAYYPYTAVSGTCQEGSKSKSVWLNQNTPWVQIKDDDEAVKEALNTYGALSVCVDAGNWQNYKMGVFQHNNVENPQCSHAVALVGYGYADNGEFYWKIRNSWADTWWGEKGYMRLSGRRTASRKIVGGIMLNFAYRPVMYGQNP